MSKLQIKQLCKQYGNNVVVNDLNLTAQSGEMISLLGPSGCGKTTTLRMIAGLQPPSSGSITLNDEDLTFKAPHKRDIGLVFQNYALFPHLNVYDNVAFGLRRHGVPKAEISKLVHEALQSVQLAGMEKRFPAQLSGGQQQRVALARTLVLKPPLVLFDEPLSNLDAKLRQLLRIEIRALQRQYGFTGIFVTHDQEEAMVLSDRIAVMNQGRIVQIGTPQQIYMQPANSFVADFVGESNLLQIAEARVADGSWHIELTGGQKVTANQMVGDQPPTCAMVRPEAVEVMSAATAEKKGDTTDFNALSGTVSFIHYTGATYLIGIAIDLMEKHFVARIDNKSARVDLGIGEKAIVRWPVQSTLLL